MFASRSRLPGGVRAGARGRARRVAGRRGGKISRSGQADTPAARWRCLKEGGVAYESGYGAASYSSA